ncbi:hypothetical protein F1654_00415 [Alkalicaulis satelles]|uniref:Nitrogen regulatory protein P-II n=1 Tax=Alkalicaulis satelles TaxID=2609175 RepID=A0A5M6ZIB3_9PROT|nr:DUF190 domain-containing protein [Alkalicaulis satelles]KAA5804509.1 hypothetical protein F1654_00415 [Alkalicaulis satelles]
MPRPIRKKIIAIVEAAHLRRLVDLMQGCGAAGLTVIDGREGYGVTGDWTREGVFEAVEMKIVHTVVNAQTADAVFEKAEVFFRRYPGIIYAHDVEVVRGERF